MSIFSSFKELFKDAILPPICAVCGNICETFLCETCLLKIKFLGSSVCARCGKPLDTGFEKNISQAKICSLCKIENYSFYMARSFAHYGDEIAEIIHKYKYRKLYYLNDVILYFLKIAYEYYYSAEKIDFIETVPAYKAYSGRINEIGGYGSQGKKNHMRFLAEKLSICLSIPFGDNIIKTRQTQRQKELDRDLRKINLKDSFKVKNSLEIKGKNILLIDDVWTTGSTLNEISRQMKNSGADRIYLLTVARGA